MGGGGGGAPPPPRARAAAAAEGGGGGEAAGRPPPPRAARISASPSRQRGRPSVSGRAVLSCRAGRLPASEVGHERDAGGTSHPRSAGSCVARADLLDGTGGCGQLSRPWA